MPLVASGNIDPGRLDRRVSLQMPLRTRDAAGGAITAWVDAGSVWASKLPVGGGRMYAAEAKHFESSLVYRIRARPDVVAGWRLVHGDDVFEIVNVEEQGRDHYIDLALRGIDQTPGTALHVLLLEGTGATPFLLEDGTPLELETAA